jgi:ferric-dicitrate binding protein FerR (iron transport regulator)
VAKIIARHYGIKVNLANSTVGEKKISGVMPNDNLDVLIEALEATGEFKVTKAKDEIIISDQ